MLVRVCVRERKATVRKRKSCCRVYLSQLLFVIMSLYVCVCACVSSVCSTFLTVSSCDPFLRVPYFPKLVSALHCAFELNYIVLTPLKKQYTFYFLLRII